MLFISVEIIGLLLKAIAHVHVLFICEKMPFYSAVFGIFLEPFVWLSMSLAAAM